MTGSRVRFEVTGVASILAELKEISDPKKLEKTTRESLGRSATKVIAPKLAKAGGWKYGGHGGANPTKGLLGERRRITARRIKTRQGEFVAIGIKPRGWAGTVSAWVVKGTKPHVIRSERKGGALLVNGRPVKEVRHPGATPNDYIRAAVSPSDERAVMAQLEADLFKAMERAKRAAPK